MRLRARCRATSMRSSAVLRGIATWTDCAALSAPRSPWVDPPPLVTTGRPRFHIHCALRTAASARVQLSVFLCCFSDLLGINY